MSFSEVQIGLPFFNDINKQSRNKPYFTTYLSEWIALKAKLPTFQFVVPVDDATITDFDLINVDTGTSVSYLTHFLANATSYNGDIRKWWQYDGTASLSVIPDTGRYYLYVKSTDGVEKYSEVFTATNNTEPSSSITGFIDIGLPFFDDINKQLSKRVNFNSYLANWLSADNRYPAFMFNAGSSSGVATFLLINSVTGVQTDVSAHFNANMVETVVGTDYYYTYQGLVDVAVDNGRYYFYVFTNSAIAFYSEEFTMCGNIEVTSDYLLLGSTDVLLLDATDKLIIG